MGGMCVSSIALYIVGFIYFGLTDKDALRSETFSIQKMAIQKGFIGDDKSGYIPLEQNASQLIALPQKEVGADSEDAQ